MIAPVAFLIFNRPHLTERVFAAIAQAKPAQLLVVADGPRADHPTDADLCARTRAIIEQVDWPCEVHKLYADTNMGLRNSVSSGLDWVFSTVEEAIIFEDDCLPDPTFFPFCTELLAHYRDDTRVAQIGGVNFTFGQHRLDTSYTFIRTPQIWGWASWRRAWRFYDVKIPIWKLLRNDPRLKTAFAEGLSRMDYRILDGLYTGKLRNTWDYQWFFTCHVQNMLTIVPSTNLVTNIGFGTGATHTIGQSKVADVPTVPMTYPLVHPPYMIPDAEFEGILRKNSQPPLHIRVGTRVIPGPAKPFVLQQYRRLTKQD